MSRDPSFELVTTSDIDPGQKLVVGVADVGVAGLTAVDYLTNHVEAEQVGHVVTENVPDITPFTEGKPRHPIRLYDLRNTDLIALESEVFLPVQATDPLGNALFDWAQANDVAEVAVLFGAPFPHGEEEHVVFHVGTEEFRESNFEDGGRPLPGGFFDGVVGELVTRGLDPSTPPVGVLVTPAHYPGPDLEGSIRLLEGLESIYDVGVDVGELQDRSEDRNRFYRELADRMQTLQEGDGGQSDYPNNRMFM